MTEWSRALITIAFLAVWLSSMSCSGGQPGREAKYAVRDGDLAAVTTLVPDRASAQKADAAGLTLLHYAAESGQLDVAKYLIDKGADVNARSLRGFTPLHKAAENGNPAVIKLLLDRGANASTRTSGGRTALDLALAGGATLAADELRAATSTPMTD